jgi:hypothetical protein
MIVSFRHSFVFVAIPKTGSQALRECLRPLLAENDWEQCTLFERRLFPVEPLAALGHGHIEWQELRPFLLGRLEAMTSFAVVREPFARFASLARFIYRDESGLPEDYRDRLKTLLSDQVRSRHILLREQHCFVCDESGAVRTRILRHEQLDEELAELGSELQLAIAPPPRVNVSPADRPFVYDAELRDMVRGRYAEDFRLFGYDPKEAGA